MIAQYYIYRNLHTDGFSVKHRGIVVDRFEFGYSGQTVLKVGLGGAATVRQNKCKYVHAYAVCGAYRKVDEDLLPVVTTKDMEITYNPYVDNSFVWKDNREPVDKVKLLIFKKGKIYGIAYSG